MSLTLYFYKVKKGAKPNCKTKEWYCQRRMYHTYEFLCDGEEMTDKNGCPIYQLTRSILEEIQALKKQYDEYSWGFTSYDDECEAEGVKWLCKRNFDFDKYDYYVLNA